MNKSSFEQNGGTYRTVGDYRIPNITLPAEASKPLGMWGLKRKDYLMQASAMFSRLVEQMKVNEGITEQLKADDQMEWVSRMNNIEARAREIINHELIFTA